MAEWVKSTSTVKAYLSLYQIHILTSLVDERLRKIERAKRFNLDNTGSEYDALKAIRKELSEAGT